MLARQYVVTQDKLGREHVRHLEDFRRFNLEDLGHNERENLL